MTFGIAPFVQQLNQGMLFHAFADVIHWSSGMPLCDPMILFAPISQSRGYLSVCDPPTKFDQYFVFGHVNFEPLLAEPFDALTPKQSTGMLQLRFHSSSSSMDTTHRHDGMVSRISKYSPFYL